MTHNHTEGSDAPKKTLEQLAVGTPFEGLIKGNDVVATDPETTTDTLESATSSREAIEYILGHWPAHSKQNCVLASQLNYLLSKAEQEAHHAGFIEGYNYCYEELNTKMKGK